jgi:hypothetical protein
LSRKQHNREKAEQKSLPHTIVSKHNSTAQGRVFFIFSKTAIIDEMFYCSRALNQFAIIGGKSRCTLLLTYMPM